MAQDGSATDPESMQTILRILREDLNTITSSTADDHEVALSLLAEEIVQAQRTEVDRLYALRLDGRANATAEERAASGLRAAETLSEAFARTAITDGSSSASEYTSATNGETQAATPTTLESQTNESDNDRASSNYQSAPETPNAPDTGIEQASSNCDSAPEASDSPELEKTNGHARKKTKPCVSCDARAEDSDDLHIVPCGHTYCGDCIRRLFLDSFTDESLFPPRCCTQPMATATSKGGCDDLLQVIGEEIERTYWAKEEEFKTVDRVYCSNANCGQFLNKALEDTDSNTVECPSCHSVTCTLCKRGRHDGSECPEDPQLKETLDLAKKEGWQTCSSCNRIVELTAGCNHITCRCKAQFCYVCGAEWKKCSCPQWDEPRLYARAGELVAQHQPELQGRAGAVQVEVVAEHLRTHHNCNHVRAWDKVAGRHKCDTCNDWLGLYIFQCRRCGVQRCRQCRLNRA